MKLRTSLAASILVIFLTNSPAAIFTWDTASGDSSLTGGNGTWDTSSALWSTDGGATNVTWPAASTGDDDAVFGGTSGTVTVAAGGVTANHITFSSAGYTITGAAVTLDGSAAGINTAADATISSVISGSVGLVKLGAGKLTLSNANNYNGNTVIEQGTLELLGGNDRIGNSGSMVFAGTGSVVFGGNAQTLANLALTTTAGNVTGTALNGSLTLNGANALVISPSSVTGGRIAEIDASGLSSLTINKPGQSLQVGGFAGASSPGNSGMLRLSESTNVIQVASVNVGTSSGANASNVLNKGEMELGTSNTIHADNWTLGNTRDGGIVRFRSGLTNPTVTLRGSNGTSPVTKITIGQNGAGGTGVGTSNMDLTSGAVDILATEILLSRGFSTATTANAPAVSGSFSFFEGNVVADTVWLSKNESGGRNNSNTSHFFQLGGNAKINSLVFGQTTHTGTVTSSTTGVTFNAQYTLSAGELRAAEIKAGTGSFWTATTRRINFNGGTIANYDANTDLSINGVSGTGGSISIVLGSTGTPTFRADAGRSVTIGAFTAITGSGSLTKSGAGQVTMAGTSTHSGDTIPKEGSLVIANSNTLSASTLDLADENLGTISFDGFTSLAVGGIKGTRSISLLNAALAGIALTVGQNNQSTIYKGAINQSSAIRKIGTGLWEYDPGSSHSSVLAGLNVSGGTLHLKSGNFTVTGSATTGSPDSMSGVIVSRGGTLRIDGAAISATGGSFVITSGNTLGGSNHFILDSGSFDAGTREVLNAYGATGTFTINNGTFSAGEFRVSQSATGTVNLNGGTLRVTKIKHNNNTEIVNFNGGTLQARADVPDLITADIDNAWIKAGGLTVDTDGFNVTIPKLLAADPDSAGGGLTKTGNGMLTLTAPNSYTGLTKINHGELRVNVNHGSATGNVIVGDSEGEPGTAILSGNGNIGGAITVNADGVIAPGAGVGPLSTASAVSGNGRISIELNGAASDQLNITGSGTIQVTSLSLQLSVISAPTEASYVLIDSATPIIGTAFASVNGLPAGYQLVFDNTLHQVRMEQLPPTASYAAFAETIVDVNKRAKLDDADSDGINNQLEYTLGGNPNVADSSILPQVSLTTPNAVFRFKRSDSSENDVTQTFQWSNNLQNWNDITLGTTSAGQVTIEENANDHDDVTITIPLGENTKIFGRLRTSTP